MSCATVTWKRPSLALHLAMLFKELVEQHRVHCIVAHGVDFAVLVAHDQVGFTLATSSAIKPNSGLFVLSLL